MATASEHMPGSIECRWCSRQDDPVQIAKHAFLGHEHLIEGAERLRDGLYYRGERILPLFELAAAPERTSYVQPSPAIEGLGWPESMQEFRCRKDGCAKAAGTAWGREVHERRAHGQIFGPPTEFPKRKSKDAVEGEDAGDARVGPDLGHAAAEGTGSAGPDPSPSAPNSDGPELVGEILSRAGVRVLNEEWAPCGSAISAGHEDADVVEAVEEPGNPHWEADGFLDPELEAMATCVAALMPLDRGQAKRVLEYLACRFVADVEPADG